MKVGLGWTSPGQDLQYQSDLPSQIILLRRDGKAEPLLFDTNPCHIYHFGNVYENEVTGEITFNAVCLPPGMKMDFQYKIWLSNVDVSPGRVFEFTLNIHTGKVVRTLADSCSCEFPSVHPYRNVQSCNNKPSRYLYLMANDQGQNLPYIDVVKYDTEVFRILRVYFVVNRSCRRKKDKLGALMVLLENQYLFLELDLRQRTMNRMKTMDMFWFKSTM